MAIELAEPPIHYVPLRETDAAKVWGVVDPIACGLRFYEAQHAEPGAPIVHLGAFLSPDEAADACRDVCDANPSWFAAEHCRVVERLLRMGGGPRSARSR